MLTSKAAAIGLTLAPAVVLGAVAGKRVLERVPERCFLILIEVFLVAAGTGCSCAAETLLTLHSGMLA